MSTTFYLRASDAFKPAITLGQGLPKEVNGLPAFYFWKDGISAGRYVHPVKKFELEVTPQRIDGWVSNFQKMRANRVEVPIVADHEESAEKTLGYIVDVKRDGDRFMELHQFLGEQARDTGLRNKVSLGIDPNFTDGKGTGYGEAIRHSAMTPVPVASDQGEFVPLAASRGLGDGIDVFELAAPNPSQRRSAMSIELSAETIERVKQLVPGIDKDDELVSKLITHLEAADAADAEELGGAGAVANLSRAERASKASEQRTANRTTAQQLSRAQADLVAKDQKITELSAKLPRGLDPEAEVALLSAIEVKKGLAVQRGALSPAVADLLFSKLAKTAGKSGKVNTLGLSRAANPHGEQALALEVFDALLDNKPVATGEQSGLQLLSRAEEDADQKAQKEAERVTSLMLSAANGAGSIPAK